MGSASNGTTSPKAGRRRFPSVTVIGAGNWGSALALALHNAKIPVTEIVVRRKSSASLQLAATIDARSVTLNRAQLNAEIYWICTPDSAIGKVAAALSARLQVTRGLEKKNSGNGPIVFHSSGALAANELDALRPVHAALASVHPLMTFPTRARPKQAAASRPLAGVPFAIEGDANAIRTAKRLVRAMGGRPFTIRPESKVLYHAFGAFTSPLLAALLAAAGETAAAAGWPPRQARARMRPIVERTIRNFFDDGPSKSFSGPIARGDVATVVRHLEALQAHPRVAAVYRELSRFAVHSFPSAHAAQMQRLLDGGKIGPGKSRSSSRRPG